ncbi:hypothetical protein [Inquilinus sp. OTU3971]|uniref:hypothetical protein n=1 Tax=Inquilinus sp. OTU3971 TaxID=3043855 RepID=UPI00313BB86B
MATIRDYLDIADAAYQNDPEGHVPNRWRVRKTEKATWYGNGFQGSVFEGNEEVIVAFSGTKGGPMSAPVSQNSANARIAVLVIPNMAGSAKKLVRWGEQNCGGKPVSIVGHSLGGALAQVVGAWSGRPFVSLNGPGMEAHLKASAFNVFKPRQMARSLRARRKGAPVGLCLNVRGDFVGTYGKGYIGEVRELRPDAGEPTHSIDAIRDALPQDDLAKQPWMLSASWPATRIGNSAPRLGNVPSSGPSLTERIAGHPLFRPGAVPAGREAADVQDGIRDPAIPKPVLPRRPAAPPLAPARSAPPPAEAAEATDLDQDYDRLMAEVNVWLEDIGERTTEEEPAVASAGLDETIALADEWIALGAWLTSLTGIPPRSLESVLADARKGGSNRGGEGPGRPD